MKPETRLYNGDCLDILPQLDVKFDLVLVDMPYGEFKKDFDKKIDLPSMWEAVIPLCKPETRFCFFANLKFAAELMASKKAWYRYEWMWVKNYGANSASVKYVPFREHEFILVFYRKFSVYNPQRIYRSKKSLHRYPIGVSKDKSRGTVHPHTGIKTIDSISTKDGKRAPSSVLYYDLPQSGHHPTEKPIDLLKHQILTYTSPGDRVLDFCMGSGSTGVAAKTLQRHFVGIEKKKEFFDTAVQRINETAAQGIL